MIKLDLDFFCMIKCKKEKFLEYFVIYFYKYWLVNSYYLKMNNDDLYIIIYV